MSQKSTSASLRSMDIAALSRRTISQFHIPRPRSLGDFIIYPKRWAVPNLRDYSKLWGRIKTNLLYFQTNYLIFSLCMFAVIMLLSMKTLLTGLISVVIITLGVLFFCEYIPQARQIKQNHPTIVIVIGIALVVVGWHALHTILLAASSLIAPIPVVLIHAAFRSTANLMTPAQVNENMLATPLGQVMQMIGVEPKMSTNE